MAMRTVNVINDKGEVLMVLKVEAQLLTDRINGGGRASLRNEVAYFFNDHVRTGYGSLKVCAHFDDECQKCAGRLEQNPTGGFYHNCNNKRCENGAPSVQQLTELMKKYPFGSQEYAGAYMERLTRLWREQ